MSSRRSSAFMRGTTPEMRDTVREATARGWTVDTTAKGHIRLRKPGFGTVIAGSSVHRTSVRLLRAQLARTERAHRGETET